VNILNSALGERPLILETPIDETRSDIENLEKVIALFDGSARARSAGGL
jgi:hypothetical protein